MAPGQTPLILASTNTQMAVSNLLISGLSNAVIYTPSTAAQSFYGAIPPKLSLGPTGLSSCYNSATGYVGLSLLQWGINPYADSQSIRAPLVRFSTQSVEITGTVNTTTTTSSLARLDKLLNQLPGVPVYTISLQFSVTQDFNFTTEINGLKKSNFTLPICTVYNGVRYVACSGCNVSSYTNHNVTYSCFDITQLCPSSLIRVGRNLDGTEDGSDININSIGLRNLDMVKDTSEEISTYGVLLERLENELSSTLSSNPFALDLSEAVAILSFMGGLVGFIVLSLFMFRRMDNHEKVHFL
jgi:hypothetical protein